MKDVGEVYPIALGSQDLHVVKLAIESAEATSSVARHRVQGLVHPMAAVPTPRKAGGLLRFERHRGETSSRTGLSSSAAGPTVFSGPPTIWTFFLADAVSKGRISAAGSSNFLLCNQLLRHWAAT